MKHEPDDIKIGEILEPGTERQQSEQAKKVRKNFWNVLARAASRIPFIEELVAAYYCALDSKTPRRARAVLLAALAYFVLPFDFVPDVLLGIGFTDDVAVLMAALTAIRTHITPAHYAAAKEALDRHPSIKPKNN